MVRYDLPQAVTDAMTAVLASNAVYQYWFPSYTSFMGQPVTGSKTGTTRISLSTSSLEMLIGTFMVQNRDTQSYPMLGNFNSYSLATQASAEYGLSDTPEVKMRHQQLLMIYMELIILFIHL